MLMPICVAIKPQLQPLVSYMKTFFCTMVSWPRFTQTKDGILNLHSSSFCVTYQELGILELEETHFSPCLGIQLHKA